MVPLVLNFRLHGSQIRARIGFGETGTAQLFPRHQIGNVFLLGLFGPPFHDGIGTGQGLKVKGRTEAGVYCGNLLTDNRVGKKARLTASVTGGERASKKTHFPHHSDHFPDVPFSL